MIIYLFNVYVCINNLIIKILQLSTLIIILIVVFKDYISLKFTIKKRNINKKFVFIITVTQMIPEIKTLWFMQKKNNNTRKKNKKVERRHCSHTYKFNENNKQPKS